MNDDATRTQARAILDACRRAEWHLYGPGPAKKKVGNAAACFSAYTNAAPPLGAHVRDVHSATTLRGMEVNLRALRELAEAFAEPEKTDG